jgi:hypothetical protein
VGGGGEWGGDAAISCLHKRVVVVVGSDTAWLWCWGRVSVVFEVVEVVLGGWWCWGCVQDTLVLCSKWWWWCWGCVCVVCLPAREVVVPHQPIVFASEGSGGEAVTSPARVSQRGGRAASHCLHLVTRFPAVLVLWSCLIIN